MPHGSARRFMSTARPFRLFLVAGEVSGDLHGAELAREIAALDPMVCLQGIGGRHMASAGVSLIADSSDWGVIGWFEAARRLPPFLRRLSALVDRLVADPPHALVLIDFPGFNLALLKRLRGRVPAVYYVPPMVALRRGDRAARVAALGARLLAIFPFEAEAYRRAGADVAFVGHPATELARSSDEAAREGTACARARIGVAPAAPVVGLLPGSRGLELDALLLPMLEAARAIRAELPGVEFAMAEASPVFRGRLSAAVELSGLPVTIVPGSRDVMAASTVLLMASGTATVEAMILGVPMVVTYRVSRPTWWYARAAFRVRWISIPNIMAGEPMVPELLQGRATAGEMSRAVLALLRDAPARETVSRRLRSLAGALGPPGAARRAAAEVLSTAASGLERPSSRPVR